MVITLVRGMMHMQMKSWSIHVTPSLSLRGHLLRAMQMISSSILSDCRFQHGRYSLTPWCSRGPPISTPATCSLYMPMLYQKQQRLGLATRHSHSSYKPDLIRLCMSRQLLLLATVLGGLLVWTHVRSTSRQLAFSTSQGLSSRGLESSELCPPAAVDWSKFSDPGPSVQGTAAIFTQDSWADQGLVWLIYGLQSMGYQVNLQALSDDLAQAQAFIARAQGNPVADMRKVQLHQVSQQGLNLNAPMVKVFVHVTSGNAPLVYGRGSSNLLVITPSLAHTTMPTSPPSHDSALSTYDYLLYRSTPSYVMHSPSMYPAMERLQRSNAMFPLIDVLPIPVVTTSLAPPRDPQSQYGITLSMSKYDPSKRQLLLDALQAFKTLSSQPAATDSAGHADPVSAIQLVVCSWLMPGIADDLHYLNDAVKQLQIKSMYEYRVEPTPPVEPYSGIALVWHLFNLDVKPHSTVLGAMLAGVMPVDCTGVMARQPAQDGLVFKACDAATDLPALSRAYIELTDEQRDVQRRNMVHHVLRHVADAFKGKTFQVVHRSFRSKVARFFMTESMPAYKARLNPGVQAGRDASAAPALGKTRYAAVIVEARVHYAFLYVMLNAAWYLPGWALHVVHSNMNEGFVRQLVSPYLDVSYHRLDADNVDIDDYNLLMKNVTFWQSFNVDYVLLFQTDSLIVKPGIHSFAKYDYIGAPWHLENERWSQPALRSALPSGVGNGGLSLRSVASMVDICTELCPTSPLKEQEDLFYALNIHKHASYELATRQDAYDFCVEVPCADLKLKGLPHALHASWYYNDLRAMQMFLDGSMYGLTGDCV